MATMHHNPETWLDWKELLQSWWQGDTPVGGVLLAAMTAAVRVTYQGGGWKQTALEGVLCGALTLTVVATLDYFSLPKSLTPAIGGAIGFIGVQQIQRFAMYILQRKLGMPTDKER
ncbi:phage holin, lambda family [Edwardsiella ictaluri]|uniref:Phage holin, lambda family, putative n=1 Tax=Edwardsiella ictaluri (strain 93-146) TaxID=634503 RepID=C5B894_EDWI9|nr:phage holin, lambda family [Edwardsiella ictaluri]ACR69466.1 phage holin, lambda family, putative [Edwardsiella ictaluri 93-146]AVZ83514.1 phage holin, lambda family [Edwardsiella ictaluri]EKS7764722.1 phage holin, lambda family [Edwardsiella ictaluri]EKS7771594.1 phage holin, lambda family [Edwardsiella ictaluri]EKS7774743.1 phage holin, lambda family [Edwardsiella ictaluri]